MTPGGAAIRMRAARLWARTEVRFLLLGGALLCVSLIAQSPASKRSQEARLERSVFVAGGDAERQQLARVSFGMYLPHKRWLYFASMGNGPLAADAVWIKSAGYVTREFGAEYKGLKFEWLRKLYTTVYDLDQTWTKAMHVSSMILSSVRQDPASAVQLLHRSMMRNPDVWYLPYQAGVSCLLWPGHSAEAVRYFREAVRRPGCPAILEQVIPRLMSEAGRMDEAVRHARARYLMGGPKALRAGVLWQLAEFTSLQLQRDLENAIARFLSDKGRLPSELAELRTAGPYMMHFDVHFAEEVVLFDDRHAKFMALHGTPVPGVAPVPLAALAGQGFINRAVLMGKAPPPEALDAYGRPFLYHAPTGTVRSEGVALIEAKLTGGVIQGALNKFRREEGRNAEGLDELAAWFDGQMRAGRTLIQEWSQRLAGGRPPEHPFAAWGARFGYDPVRGAVVPDERYTETPTVEKVEELRKRD